MPMVAKLFGHPIHPMLVVFPLGLWIFSFTCDLIYAWRGTAPWRDVANYTMAGGVVGGLLAAVPGWIDFRAIAAPSLRRLAWAHMLLNLGLVALFAVNFGIRLRARRGRGLVLLSAVGVALLGLSGWLGGELVYVHGIGVGTAPTLAGLAVAADQTKPAAVVEMTNRLTFTPGAVTIRRGETVEWRNSSAMAHTVTAEASKAANRQDVELPQGADPFDSGSILPGGTYRHAFTAPGRYKYICVPHELAGMQGEVDVQS
jgi:uncharacterized membrane protein